MSRDESAAAWTYHEEMREGKPEFCWAYVASDRVCILDRGHDDGVHESGEHPVAQRQDLEAVAARLKALPEGWDSYGSVVIDPETADKAVELALALAPHFPSYGTPALVPTSDGAVQVECHSDGWNMECYLRRAK